jgi:hypothetical protein
MWMPCECTLGHMRKDEKAMLLGCRFLTLVDVLYEHHIRLFCSSEGLPFELFLHILTRSQAKEPKAVEVRWAPSPLDLQPHTQDKAVLRKTRLIVSSQCVCCCAALSTLFKVPLCWGLLLLKLTDMSHTCI